MEVEFIRYNQLAALSTSEHVGGKTGKPAFDLKGEEGYALGVAAIASRVVGFAVDFTVKELEKEAKRYTATYDAGASAAGYWVPTGDDYVGFVLRRTTEEHPDRNSPALLLVAAFELLDGRFPDNGQYVIQPLYLRVRSSKAKVLERRWWAIPSWFKPSTPDVDVDLALSLRASWQHGGFLRNAEFATLTLPTITCDLDSEEPKLCRRAEDGSLLPESPRPSAAFGFPGMPRPSEGDVKHHPLAQAGGALTVKLVVTERDSANAGADIQRAATLLEGKKDDIVRWIVPSEEERSLQDGDRARTRPEDGRSDRPLEAPVPVGER
ncbi:MAG TPA: hypothetical protein VMT18_12330 [Planctomycetota bacterium]|nr:hypothetical protein [Planctomycetota bacterium]